MSDMQEKSRLHFGLAREREAEAWLLAQSDGRPRQVIARNFRVRGGEIDLVIEEGSELVFIEVRSRARGAWVGALESVTLPKRFRLRNAINAFLLRYPGRATSIRIDIVANDGMGWSVTKGIELPSRS